MVERPKRPCEYRESLAPSTIRILQWNVWHRAKIKDVTDHLQEVDADVFCLQELTTDSPFNPNVNTPQFISEVLEMPHYYFQLSRSMRRSGQSTPILDGAGIFSKFPLLEVRDHILSRGGWEPFKESEVVRKLLEAKIDIPGKKPLKIGNVHLSWFLPTRKHKMIRVEEGDRLSDILHERKEEGRYVLTGDFNAGPNFRSVRQVGQILQSCGEDIDPTWRPTQKVLARMKMFGRRLDYAFSTEDLVTQTEILDRGPSDHHPLLVTVTL